MSDVKNQQPNPKSKEKIIDVERVFKTKNPKAARWIPGFVFSWIRRIVHENELNDFMEKNNEKQDLDFIHAAIEYFDLEFDVKGFDRVPDAGRFIIAANHPLGGLDGIALLHIMSEKRTDLIFPVNDILMNVPNVRNMFIPINKHGKNTENIKTIDDSFASENMILYFPAGLCSRKQSGVILDTEWKHTFVNKAVRHERDVIPIHFSGKNSNFFYNLARLRKFLKIKVNIEMFFLVNEMFKQKDSKFTITIGNPIPFATFKDRSIKPKKWAEKVKQHVYDLKSDPDKDFLS